MSSEEDLLLYQIILALLRIANSQSQNNDESISEKIKKTRAEIDEEMTRLNE